MGNQEQALARLTADRQARANMLMLLDAEDARESGSASFEAFVKQAWQYIPGAGALQWNWYLSALALHLEEVARGRVKRLVGNGPPRNGKSNLFAILWPAWVWTWCPSEKFLFLSYDDRLVKEHSMSCRDVVESQWYRETYRPTWTIKSDRNTQNDFETSAGGRRIAISIKSGTTGKPAGIVGVDDPLSMEEAESAAERERARKVIANAVGTRFNDPTAGRAVILMQRVHSEDPSAWAIRAGWEHLCCPMEFDPEHRSITQHVVDGERRELWRDPRMDVGELLDPARFPASHLAQVRLDVGPDGYAAQFNERPVAARERGRYFQRGWVKRWLDVAPAAGVVRRVRSWDLASTEGGGDWTVGVRLALLSDGTFVEEDVQRAQIGPRGVRALVKSTAELDGYDVEIRVPQDPGQAGKDQAQEYATMLAGWTCHFPRPTGDKVVRFGPASAQAQAGNIAFVRGQHTEEHIKHLEAFPDPAVHDDDADALGDAITHLAQKVKTGLDLWDDVEL